MGGFLSVVISAMAVWMDLREEAVDNSWVLFSIMAGFFTTAFGKGAERHDHIPDRSSSSTYSSRNSVYIPDAWSGRC